MSRAYWKGPKKLVAILAVVAGGAFACGGSTSQAPTPSALTPVKVGWVKVPMNAPMVLMQQSAKQYGLDIQLVEFQRFPDLRVALANGDVDFGPVGPVDIALAWAQGSDAVVGLAGDDKGADLLARKAALPPLTWSDLASGKYTLGSFGGGIAWIKTVMTLQEHGYDFGKVKQLKVAGTIQDMMQTLKRGQTDVVMDVDPAIAQGVQEGYAKYADELDINKSSAGGQNAVFAANKKWLSNKAVTTAVLKDYVDSMKQLQSDTRLWAKTYESYTGLSDAIAQESLKRIELDPTYSQKSLTSLAKFLYAQGLIQRDISGTIAQAYTYTFLAAATGKSPAQLGKDA